MCSARGLVVAEKWHLGTETTLRHFGKEVRVGGGGGGRRGVAWNGGVAG